MKKRDILLLGAALLGVAVFAGNEARKDKTRIDSADGLIEHTGAVELALPDRLSYRPWSGNCYVDFRLSGGPSVGFRYFDDRANFDAIKDSLRRGQQITVAYGFCDDLYCWPAEIKASGRVLASRAQAVSEAEDDLWFAIAAAVAALLSSIVAFVAGLRRG